MAREEKTDDSPRVLIVDDEENFRAMLTEHLRDQGYGASAVGSSADALESLARDPHDAVLLDIRLGRENGIEVLRRIKRDFPDVEVVMVTAFGSVNLAVEATKLGSFDFVEKPLNHDHFDIVLKNATAQAGLRREVERMREERRREAPPGDFVGQSAVLQEIRDQIAKIATGGRSTVLIQGETGVGKELVARMVHWAREGDAGPFVVLNCASLPSELLESELFGYEKGAFTGAAGQKKGLLELASEGTLFLDEIGEMTLPLQAKLLRAIETKTFRRVGGTSDVKVATRIMAATHRDLLAMKSEGKFREDLYFRLMVIPIRVPPLRERPEDVLPIARHLVAVLNREMDRNVEGVAPDAESALVKYPWPGNVRELRNVLERAILLHSDKVIRLSDLPPEVRSGSAAPAGGTGFRLGNGQGIPTMADVEKMAIEFALGKCGGNKTKAAEALGISRQTLRTKLKDYCLAGVEDDG
ncbi:MAG: sigma-54-dependent Fis family transcriptional regulator [Candidatus Eisenbacteria bacterium]|nr:sigma-54-dependent Fis family transcriptional regulator [Candidatus Eisenbacteria bacterium]